MKTRYQYRFGVSLLPGAHPQAHPDAKLSELAAGGTGIHHTAQPSASDARQVAADDELDSFLFEDAMEQTRIEDDLFDEVALPDVCHSLNQIVQAEMSGQLLGLPSGQSRAVSIGESSPMRNGADA
tara:strand:+ start:21460 stop:21837 length:378 start_codon:yes stop_codon:yes gene_type:complete